jgi:DNA (cytosine-5)-methyltransferase 1
VIRLGSLCTGIGGLDLAVGALLDVNHAWHAETDPAASTVLAAHWPDVPNLGDITRVDWQGPRGRRADRASTGRGREADVLTAGFPCQPFSAAGQRAGADDPRHLWPTGVLPAIAACRPPLVVLENVPGLLTIQHGQVFGTVLADLDGLGYAVSWTTVGACKVGACHHRHRLFIAATLAATDPPDGALFGLPLAAAGKWPPAGFVRGGLVWEMPADTCGAPGSAMLPTPRTIDGTSGVQTLVNGRTAGDRGPRLGDIGTLLPTPRASDAAKGGPNQRGSSGDLALPAAVQPGRFGTYEQAVRRQEATFGLPAPDPTEPGRLGKPRLAAAFPEWMVGLRRGWITDHVGRNEAVKIAGNGVVWQAAAYALSTLPTFRAMTETLPAGRLAGAA